MSTIRCSRSRVKRNGKWTWRHGRADHTARVTSAGKSRSWQTRAPSNRCEMNGRQHQRAVTSDRRIDVGEANHPAARLKPTLRRRQRPQSTL